ncbi:MULTISPECIES: hypothetical protein [unclassified Thiocapsa]|uniref:hypothetical protein n=1 Tax=unclassified Thiocapsa TaxID=2641286 RepID=UPI0035B2357A
MALLITLLKLISTTLAGAFGVLALLVEYKDENGKVTKWGKIALWGVIISTMVSFSMQLLEHLNAEISAQAASIRSNKILTQLVELERASQPLDKPELTIVLQIPNDFVGGEAFLSSLRTLGKELRDRKIDSSSSLSSEYIVNSHQNGRVMSFSIDRRSSYFPNRNTDPDLYSFLAQTGVKLAFIADDADLADIQQAFRSSNGRPSVGYFGQYGDYAFGIKSEDVRIQYKIEDDAISLWIRGAPQERYIRKSGEIESYPEFNESFVLLSVSYVNVPKLGDEDYPVLRSNRKSLAPSILFLRTSGRLYLIRDFDEIANAAGYKMFVDGPMDKFRRQ